MNFGIGLAIVGILDALIAGFGFRNIPFTIGGIVFAILGVIIIVASGKSGK